MTDDHSSRPKEERLDSWKDIAAHLKRDMRTVRRWEKLEGLPVHRHLHQRHSTVYAYTSEIDAWAASRKPRREEPSRWRRVASSLAFAAVLMLGLLMVADAPFSIRAVAAAHARLGGLGEAVTEAGKPILRQGWAGTGGPVAISADERHFAYVNGGALYVGDLLTGESGHITVPSEGVESSSAFSRDGKLVAYGCGNCPSRGHADLRVIALDGSRPRVLSRSDQWAGVQPFDWSADGKQILGLVLGQSGTRQIVLVSVANGSVRVVKTLDRGPMSRMSLSRDGRYVVYDFPARENSPENDIFLLDTDGGREVPLVTRATDDRYPIWAPDGSGVFFFDGETGTIRAWFLPVAGGKSQGSPELVKQDMGEIEPLVFTRSDSFYPMGFSQNGSFYYSVRSRKLELFMATLDPTTGAVAAQPRTVTHRLVTSSRVSLSSDGQYLAYSSRRPSVQGEVGAAITVIRSLANGDERELVPALSAGGGGKWSPDGRSLLVSGTDKAGRVGLFRMDAQTGEIAPILYENVSHPDWFLKGRAVVFIRGGGAGGGTVILRDLETSRETEVYRPRAPYLLGSCVEVSHDGQRLAFYIIDQRSRSNSVMVMRAPGETPRKLGPPVKYPEVIDDILALTQDGGQVLYTTYDRESALRLHKVWEIAVEGGAPREVGLPMERFGYVATASFHPDGRQVAFASDDNKNEVWELENFLPALDAKK